MGLKIATYKNKVKTLVPGYDLERHPNQDLETITVTRKSVESRKYASWSQNEEQEGMYIQAHSIVDGNLDGYKPNQLVTIVDLNYRYLSPINETVYGGTLPYQLGPGGCIEIDNLAKTIIKEQDPPQNYIFTLTPQQGYSMIPAGHVEVRIGDTWTAINGANWSDTEITPSLPGVTVKITPDKIVGNLRFVLNDCKYKITAHKVVDDSAQDADTLTFTLSCNSTDSITINSIKSQFDSASLNYAGATKDRAGTTQANDEYLRDCGGDRDVYLNYTTKTYTINDNSQCANVSITPVLSSYPYNTLVSITITPETGKATVGPGSISMVGSEPYTWRTSQDRITRTFNITGNVTISTECGDSDKYTMMFIPKDQDTEHEIGDRISTQISYNQSFDPTTISPTVIRGYEYIGVDPDETIPAVTKDKTFTHYYKKLHTVTFVGTNGVVTNSSVTVRHGGNVTTDNNIYSISEGYNSNVVNVGTLPSGVDSVNVDTDNKSITVTNVTEDVTINLSSEKLKFRVTFELDNGQSGTIKGYDDLGQPVENQSIINNIEYNGCMSVTLNLNSQYFYSGTNNPNVQQRGSVLELCEIKSDTTVTIRTSQVPPQYTVTYKIYKDSVVDETETETETVWPSTPVTKTINIDNISSYKFADTYIDSPYENTTALITSEGVSVSIPGVSQTGTVKIYLVTKTYEVKFEVYKDGTLDRSAGWTSNYTEGETFDNEIFPYDDSAYEIDDVTSQELTVDYSYGDSGEIIISNETPITENATVEIRLTSIQQRVVLSIEVTSSKMDAMGGVVFNGKINYSEGDPDIITDQEEFNLKFEIRDSNNNLYDTTVVNVHDYDFEPKRDNSSSSVKDTEGNDISGGEQTEIQKIKLNLENTTSDSLSTLTSHSYDNRTIKITLKNSDKSNTLTIPQRAEKYGYYTNIDSTTPTSELSNNNWNSNSLVDYGDAYSMYGKENEGLDVYNKDITPYYITGTYIGENPLSHLDDNKTFVMNSNPTDYNKINNSSSGHEEHYHITWYEGSGISVNSSDKGKIFTGDSISITSEFCGGDETPECGCYEYNTKGTSTLEAIKNSNEGISQPVQYTYNCSYVKPVHKYGIDSVSYYHLLNNNYRSEIIDTQDNPNPFKDVNGDNIEFSYPVHIYIREEEDTTSKNTSGLGNINSLGSGWSAYPLNTIRWTKSDDSPYYTLTPNDSYYNTYDYSNNPIYYDYANKIKTGTDSGDVLIFAPYNNPYYIFDEDNPRTGETNSNNVIVGEEPTDTPQNKLLGRDIDLYYTLMSPETLIRPIHVNNQTKFAVLTSEHNGTKYGDYSESGNCVELPLNEYVNNSLGRTRYVSEVFYDTTRIKEEPITTTDDPELGIDLDKYPYAISGINTDYLHKYVPATEGASEEYVELNERDSDGALQYKAYNLIADISFKQYYNNAIDRATKIDYYAHNSDNAKYVICTDSFDDAYYDYYNGDEISGIEDWKRILAEGIQSIDYNYSDHRWHIVTNSGEHKASYQSTTSLSYYYNLTLTLSPIYTNAHSVEISFNSCENANCGLGRWEILMLDSDNDHAILQRVARPVSDGVVTLDRNTLGHNVEIHIIVGTSEQEYNPNSDCIEYPGNINEYTGGGQINIACKWRTIGIYGEIQTRTIMANIGGTCNKPDHPNTSGTYLTWDELKQYYRDDVNGCTVFTNKGKHLVPKTAND